MLTFRLLFLSSLLSCSYAMHRINEAALLCKRAPSYGKVLDCVEVAVSAEGQFKGRHAITTAIRDARRSTTNEQALLAVEGLFSLLGGMAAAEAVSNDEIATAVVGAVAVAVVVTTIAATASKSSGGGGSSGRVKCRSDYDCHYGNMCCKALGASRGVCAIPNRRDTRPRPDPSSYQTGDGSCWVY